ncbi:hypothetical protein PTSG_07504 [Salpingoeca rosetta]|uniref:Uncharacterized protein n=1 Tax=Salpingoeca rosetta (strain ATCC 50818 / BSB-021) TaxID=946362 RepID=F2UIX2_SALR5|nr:uncharacterized protein PTSG_07504 [Salpingoeca rosetta]EGD77171.1 hypothetical protein PTSG_07504 [Salpingoeca rosetta]|eukprot:XP_004991010.1 hypothetical protein PTSG_07504 [Salpingoeca rosetta]
MTAMPSEGASIPPPVEDFLMNFLMKHNMTQTLECFQTEWHKLGNGRESAAEIESVPDVYTRSEHLERALEDCESMCAKYQQKASAAEAQFEKLRKERNHHRTAHRRILQEKKTMGQELKRLSRQVDDLRKELEELTEKHNAALREKMLAKLQRDKASQRATQLEQTARAVSASQLAPTRTTAIATTAAVANTTAQRPLPSLAKATKRLQSPVLSQSQRMPATLPRPEQLLPPPNLRPMTPGRAKALTVVNTVKASTCAVGAIALHPQGDLLAAVDDAGIMSIWQLPGGQLEQQVAAHPSWLADVRFHPDGTLLLTAGSHPKVDLWSSAGLCVVTSFLEHAHCVWSCDFHHTGDFIASGSMDNTVKVWDITTGKCLHTIRSHTDSVNVVRFQPHSNHILSGGADKIVRVTDGRTGLAVGSMEAHTNAVSDIAFTYAGDVAVSCDLDGTVCAWSMRDRTLLHTAKLGPHPANCIAVDTSGQVVAVGSGDGAIKVLALDTFDLITELQAHDDAVQALVFDHAGGFLVSCGSDGTIRLWS